MNILSTIALLVLLLLQGCSSFDFKQISYNSLLDMQCMDRVGYANCDPGRMSYQDYRAEREALLKPADAQ